MKKQIIFLMVLFVVGMVSAISMPHAFYGEVYYSDGVLIQENLEITANIDGVEETSSVVGGLYDLVVESEDDATVYFYIDGLTESIGSYTFESFAVTELDFTTELSNPNSEDDTETSSSRRGSSSSSLNTYEEYYEVSKVNNLQDLEIQEISSGITGSAIGVSDFNKVLGIGSVGLILILLILFIIIKNRKH